MLLVKLKEDLKNAMISKDKVKKSCLQVLINSLTLAEKEKKEPLTEQEGFVIVYKEISQTRDPINDFKKAGREDLVKESELKIEILESYVPKQLSEEEILVEVKQLASDNGIVDLTIKEKGKLMKIVVPVMKGRADGKLVSKVVDMLLNNK